MTEIRGILMKSPSLDSLMVTTSRNKEARFVAQDPLSYRNKTGSSLLHIAAYFGNLSLVDELHHRHGMSLQDLNSYRWSSLHYLCRFDQPLNKKLNLALKVNPARGHARRSFGFRYFKPKQN